jgi:hypothetical protein
VVARDRGASPGRRGEDADCKFVPNGASVAGDWMIVEPAPRRSRSLLTTICSVQVPGAM